MSDQNELMELGETHPNKVDFHIKLKEDQANYMDCLKKMYNNILQLNFATIEVKLQLGTLITNATKWMLILDNDLAEFQVENEEQVANEDKSE